MVSRKRAGLQLSPELERAILAGIIYGAVPPETVHPEELSPTTRLVYSAAVDMLRGGQRPPLSLSGLLLVLTDVHGIARETAREHLEALRSALPSADGVEAVVRKLRERHALLAIANTAARQLHGGEFHPEQLIEAVAHCSVFAPPEPLSSRIADGLPPPPPRLTLRLLPSFSDRLGGGLVGLTVLSGEPAVGKSTFSWQAALDVSAQGTPVLYYDLDNGMATLLDRTRQMLGNNLDAIRAATARIYLRDSVRTLESDLLHVPAPALVVVDIFQDLPTPSEFERQGLARWIHRLKALRGRGYHILVVSEVARAYYGGNVALAAYKGSGEIEYSADLGLQMVPTSAGAEVHIVKNRHGPLKGVCGRFTRARGFVWQEAPDPAANPTTADADW